MEKNSMKIIWATTISCVYVRVFKGPSKSCACTAHHLKMLTSLLAVPIIACSSCAHRFALNIFFQVSVLVAVCRFVLHQHNLRHVWRSIDWNIFVCQLNLCICSEKWTWLTNERNKNFFKLFKRLVKCLIVLFQQKMCKK